MVLADSFDLGGLGLRSGEGRRLALAVALGAYVLGGERYLAGALAEPAVSAGVDAPSAREVQRAGAAVPVTLDIARTTAAGYALRLRFAAVLHGPCMRCLEPASPRLSIDAREVYQPGGGDELESPYVRREVLDLRSWARDALALSLPPQLLCRADCAGLCPHCGANLNDSGPGHAHERSPDPRWAKLSELHLH
jgi:uncharacterized protein